MHKITVLIVGIIVAMMAVLAIACDEEIGKEQREESARTRIESQERAEAVVPVRESTNYPARRALEEFSWRVDQIDRIWYVYILGDNGNIIGYYAAQTRPVNSCTFLSSTEIVQDTGEGSGIVLTAPSLDGIYYGGAGASAGCDAWFFFDAATDAMVEIRGVKFFTADQPLLLEADPIRIAGD